MAVACGKVHVLTLDDEGLVWVLGNNLNGVCGLPNSVGYDTITVPMVIPKLINIVQISVGSYHNVCLDQSGKVYTFGRNEEGQLGIGGAPTASGAVHVLNSLENIISISCGHYWSFCIDENREVYAFGDNSRCQLALKEEKIRVPTKISGLENIKDAKGGRYHSLFLTYDGLVYSCGGNACGQLGFSDKKSRVTPALIPELVDIKQIAVGYNHSMALTCSNELFSFGGGEFGQLGHTELTGTPTKIEFENHIIRIVCGSYSSWILDSEGQIWVTGKNIIFHGNRRRTFQKISVLSGVQAMDWREIGVVKSSGGISFHPELNCITIDKSAKVGTILPTVLKEDYSSIIGSIPIHSNAKSARK